RSFRLRISPGQAVSRLRGTNILHDHLCLDELLQRLESDHWKDRTPSAASSLRPSRCSNSEASANPSILSWFAATVACCCRDAGKLISWPRCCLRGGIHQLGFLGLRSSLTIQSSIRLATWLSGVFSASAICHSRPTVGLMIPLSTRLMYVRSKPHSPLRRS